MKLVRYYASFITTLLLLSPIVTAGVVFPSKTVNQIKNKFVYVNENAYFEAREGKFSREDYQSTIKDFTQTIHFSPQEAKAYNNRDLAQIIAEKNPIVKIKVENLGYEDLQKLKAKIPQNLTMLTFDDGPDPETTPKILALLDKYNQKATFFILGDRAQKHPEIVREIERRGHEIAVHTMTHPDLRQITPLRRRQEIQQSVKILKSILGKDFKPVWFRAPYGALSPGVSEYAYRSRNNEITKEINDNDLGLVHWTIITDDWVRNPKVSRIANQISSGTGDIVVMHDSWKKNHTVAALEIGLKRLKEQEVTSIRISDLFER